MKYTMVNGKRISDMTLGTVQLGMNYGIANCTGQPDVKKSCDMLQFALDSGITALDTARAYGTAEEVLGGFLKEKREIPFVVSKFMTNLPAGSREYEVERAIITSVETSLSNLHLGKLDCLLLHRAEDMTKHGKAVEKVLSKLMAQGMVCMVGVSVYSPGEIETMLEHDIYQATQIPLSLFDGRMLYAGCMERLRQKGILTFVRSVFSQGLLFLDEDRLAQDEAMRQYVLPHVKTLHRLCDEAGISVAEFAISYIRDIPGVTSLVLGAETAEQVIQNAAYMNAPALSPQIRERAIKAFSRVDNEKIMEILSRPRVSDKRKG
ncbi:MAG: aldo/keto reductase [Ruminococcaceae bacterium]|nr:aldo/keto reductase [Oscillospiraceae bacterium]